MLLLKLFYLKERLRPSQAMLFWQTNTFRKLIYFFLIPDQSLGSILKPEHVPVAGNSFFDKKK